MSATELPIGSDAVTLRGFETWGFFPNQRRASQETKLHNVLKIAENYRWAAHDLKESLPAGACRVQLIELLRYYMQGMSETARQFRASVDDTSINLATLEDTAANGSRSPDC